MKNRILLLLIFGCCFHLARAQQSHAIKHALRPGLSFGYFPTWELDDIEGNTRANVFMAGINGYLELGKESVFIFGVSRGKFEIKDQEARLSFIDPLKLQKFFTPERKGFNLAFGFLMSYCKTCNESANGGFANEINYLFAFDPIDVNIGIQTMLGAFFDGPAIYVGPEVQVIWHPRSPKDDQ